MSRREVSEEERAIPVMISMPTHLHRELKTFLAREVVAGRGTTVSGLIRDLVEARLRADTTPARSAAEEQRRLAAFDLGHQLIAFSKGVL